MTDWMTIRVVLHGQPDHALAHPPGRIMLASTDHTFADLAEAVDTAFARWDQSQLHQFDVEGRVLLPDSDETDTGTAESSDDITLGEVGLREAAVFKYQFDLGEQWLHGCTVDAVGVDPFDQYGDEPDMPVPVYGWGTIPDQYGRLDEADDEDDEVAGDLQAIVDDPDWDDDEFLAAWDEAESHSWSVVDHALAAVDRPDDPQAVSRVMEQVRGERHSNSYPYPVLWAGVGGTDTDVPDDDTDAWVQFASGTIASVEMPPLAIDEQAAWAALELADWAGAVIELVRGGPGTPATPEDLVTHVKNCPEIEGEALSEDDESVLIQGFSVVVPLWAALGIVDSRHRLTTLGAWGLPEALRNLWE